MAAYPCKFGEAMPNLQPVAVEGTILKPLLPPPIFRTSPPRRLAKATGPKAAKTGDGLPHPGWLDPGSKMVPGLTLTARGQQKKTGGPNLGRELDQNWMNGDDADSNWKSASKYEWICPDCEQLFTPEEYLAAHRKCTRCDGIELVAAGADPWAQFNPQAPQAAPST